jgi:hypothetical protein
VIAAKTPSANYTLRTLLSFNAISARSCNTPPRWAVTSNWLARAAGAAVGTDAALTREELRRMKLDLDVEVRQRRRWSNGRGSDVARRGNAKFRPTPRLDRDLAGWPTVLVRTHPLT